MGTSCSGFRSVFLKVVCVLFISGAWLGFVSPLLNTANAAEVTLAWDANTEDNLAGYRLYYKTDSGGSPYDGTGLNEGDSPVTIHLEDLADAKSPTFTLTGLESGKQYFFVLTAFDTDGLESDYSSEVTYETSGVATYSITASASGQGAISPKGAVSVPVGASQTFTIGADANYHISGVLVDGSPVGPVGTYTFTNVIASHTISALFEIDTFTITATAGENGSISPPGVTSAAYGTSQSYTITPADGYHIADVLVDDGSVGQVSAYSFENIGTWHTIEAAFEADSGGVVDTNPGGDEGTTSAEPPAGDSQASTGGEPTGSDSSNAQADGNRAPETPVATFDTIEAPAVGPVELSVGGFSDPDSGDTHTKTEWRVFSAADGVCIFSISSSSSLTEFSVPGIMLEENSVYNWQARFFDSSDAASEWSEAARFTTGFSAVDHDGDGIPDNQKVDISVDLNHDDIPDLEQEIVKSVVMPLSNQPIGLSIENSDTATAILFLESVNVDTVAISDSNKNRARKLPLGLINFKLAVAEPGDAVTVTVHFAEPVHPRAKWMKLDVVNDIWFDYSGFTRLSDDRMSMAIDLVDGGFGDDDGVANGILVDPAGLELNDAEEGSSTEEGAADSRAGIECFIAGVVENDAMPRAMTVGGILLLLGAAVLCTWISR